MFKYSNNILNYNVYKMCIIKNIYNIRSHIDIRHWARSRLKETFRFFEKVLLALIRS